MSGFEVLRLAADFASLALAIGAFVYAHVQTRRRARSEELADLRERLERLRERVQSAEGRLEETPNSKAIHELALAIERISGDLRATVAELNGLGEIVKRLDRITERQETYLLHKREG